MYIKKKPLVFLLLTLLCSVAKADSLVLVHGYLSSAETWHRSGIAPTLTAHQWPLAGHFSAGGLRLLINQSSSSNRVYTVDLPFEAPIGRQAELLKAMLAQVRLRHPAEKIVLAGHSAGGIVARMAIVTGGADQVRKLITIASPHLGTPRAAEALSKTSDSGPMRFIKGAVAGDIYHTVRRSRGLLIDLLPPDSKNLLSWLNTRQHPDIEYTSVIRNYGDILMPAFSQDMNQVPALTGKSRLVATHTEHGLTWQDGLVLVTEL